MSSNRTTTHSIHLTVGKLFLVLENIEYLYTFRFLGFKMITFLRTSKICRRDVYGWLLKCYVCIFLKYYRGINIINVLKRLNTSLQYFAH